MAQWNQKRSQRIASLSTIDNHCDDINTESPHKLSVCLLLKNLSAVFRSDSSPPLHLSSRFNSPRRGDAFYCISTACQAPFSTFALRTALRHIQRQRGCGFYRVHHRCQHRQTRPPTSKHYNPLIFKINRQAALSVGAHYRGLPAKVKRFLKGMFSSAQFSSRNAIRRRIYARTWRACDAEQPKS